MRGSPLSTTVPTEPFMTRMVPAISTSTTAIPVPTADDLLRQVWAARPLDWQSGDPAFAAAMQAVRAHLASTGVLS